MTSRYNKWHIVGTKGVVLKKPIVLDKKAGIQQFSAYRTIPVCPGVNWVETYPETSYSRFNSFKEALEWVQANPIGLEDVYSNQTSTDKGEVVGSSPTELL